MGKYFDRLQTEYDDITRAMQTVIDHAANENRDLTDSENEQIERDDKRRTDLGKSIQYHADLAGRTANIQALQIPSTITRMKVETPEPAFDIVREIPSPGHYAALIHRALVKRDREAIEMIERVTAHQLTTTNPGVIPNPIVAPVISALESTRPFISSVGVRPAPTGKFDRPLVTQHVAVAAQTAEKTETASQEMVITPVPVALQTHAGHLNISKQDIRWSQPSILNLVYEDFAKVYARVSDTVACSDFVAAVTQTAEIPSTGPAGPADIDAILGDAAGTIAGSSGDEGELNHIWLSRDVAVTLASLRNANSGNKIYNIPLTNGTSGDLDGIPVTIDPRFAANTAIAGDSSMVEFFEDMEGFLTVDEPSVLGQMVGYAGYNKLVVLDATKFVQFTNTLVQSAESGSSPRRGRPRNAD